MIEYTIEPVLMGGTIKELTENEVKVHLKGRLGVFTLPKSFLKGSERAKTGDKLRFYFERGYVQ